MTLVTGPLLPPRPISCPGAVSVFGVFISAEQPRALYHELHLLVPRGSPYLKVGSTRRAGASGLLADGSQQLDHGGKGSALIC